MKKEWGKPDGGSSTSALTNEVTNSLGGEGRNVTLVIHSIIWNNKSQLAENEAELERDANITRKWKITVIGNWIDGLERRRWPQRLLP